MAIAKSTPLIALFLDRKVIQDYLDRQDIENPRPGGSPPTAQEVREMMLECGIRPEDNECSRGIIEMREE